MLTFSIFFTAFFMLVFFVLGIIFKALSSVFQSVFSSLEIIIAAVVLVASFLIILLMLVFSWKALEEGGIFNAILALIGGGLIVALDLAIISVIGSVVLPIIIFIPAFILILTSQVCELLADAFESKYRKALNKMHQLLQSY